MTGSVNKVILIGHAGKDPEVRSLNSGGKVVTLSIATSESWNDRASGERREKTEWHRVVIFNETLAGVAEKYVRKGSAVFVEGQLQTRKWQDQQGADRYSTEVVLGPYKSTLTLLDKREDSDGGGYDQRRDQSQRPAGREAARATGGRGGYRDSKPTGGPSWDASLEDEIPF